MPRNFAQSSSSTINDCDNPSHLFPVEIQEFINTSDFSAYSRDAGDKQLLLLSILQGNVSIAIDDERVSLCQGQCIFINENRPYVFELDDSRPLHAIQIRFNSKLISHFPGSNLEHKYALPILRSDVVNYHVFHDFTNQEPNPNSSMLQIWEALREQQWGYEVKIMSCLLNIWYSLLSELKELISRESTWSKDERIRCKIILAYIENNYAKKITLQDLADIIHISKEEFCRFFKRAMMCTAIEYLNNFRLNKSLELLMNTDLPIVHIALDVGFSSASYYAEQFKRFTGHTPTEFRRNCKANLNF